MKIFSPFLKRGITSDPFHSEGTCPVPYKNWYFRFSIGASSSAAALRIYVGIPFGLRLAFLSIYMVSGPSATF